MVHPFSDIICFRMQAFAQVPDLTLWYGPDTYMGRNLAQMFTAMASLSNEAIAQLHPQHTQASIKALLPRLHCFQEGACIVHHLFGSEVTQLVQKAYGDAFLTAHFEVGSPATWSICILPPEPFMPSPLSMGCVPFPCLLGMQTCRHLWMRGGAVPSYPRASEGIEHLLYQPVTAVKGAWGE